MPVIVKFDPTANSQQAQVINDATEFNDGVMTKEQVRLLNSLTPGINTNVVIVTEFPGTDLGAQFLAADAFLGATPGTLLVPDGDYLWTTHITGANPIRSNRKIIFGAGLITCIGADPFFFPYPGPMMALSSNISVEGQGDATVFDEPDSSVVFAELGTSEHVTYHDFKIQNIANGEPLSLGSSLPNIGSDNAFNTTVDHITFQNTRSLSFSSGGDSTLGDHGDVVNVFDCTFDGVKTITLAAVNTRNFKYKDNAFLNVGAVGPSAPYLAIVCIDLEPNILTDVMEIGNVSDNTFDLTNNKGGAAILVQGAGVGQDIVVANNVIKCGTDAGAGPTGGIGVNGQSKVRVADNQVIGQFSQVPISVNGGSFNSVQDNTIQSSGGAPAFRCISVRGPASHTSVFGNKLIVTNADSGWAAIVEDATCDNTHVFGNDLFSGTLALFPPTIILGGTDSRQWMNSLNGVMMEGAVAGCAAYSTVPLAEVSAPANNAASNFTTGTLFYFTTRTAQITGVTFYWNNATALSVRCKLYDAGGAELAAVDVAVSGVGVYTGLFAAPVPVDAATPTWATIYELTGARQQLGVAPATAPAVPFFGGRGLVCLESGSAAGNAIPNTDDTATTRYPVWPVYFTTGLSP